MQSFIICIHNSALLIRWSSSFLSPFLFPKRPYILYFSVPPSYLYHLRIFLPCIDWICLFLGSGRNIYYTKHFKSFGWAEGEIHISKVQIYQNKLFLCRIQFLWGKWRYNVWDMLMNLNIKEGGNEWKNPLINQENIYWTCYSAAYCGY